GEAEGHKEVFAGLMERVFVGGLNRFGLFGERSYPLSELGTVYHRRGAARARLGDLAGADADFSKVLELQPEYDPGYRDRRLVRLRQGRAAEAQQDFDAFLRALPDQRADLEAEVKKIRAQVK